tara:strand:+ start:1114 stop:1332 length:219 start_codon:yes stop_codon:yes gene_type:complete
MMPNLTPEQEAKLNEINAGEGKTLSPSQKAIILKFGTIDIKGKKPNESMSVDIPAGPKVVPKQRELPTMEDK